MGMVPAPWEMADEDESHMSELDGHEWRFLGLVFVAWNEELFTGWWFGCHFFPIYWE